MADVTPDIPDLAKGISNMNIGENSFTDAMYFEPVLGKLNSDIKVERLPIPPII